MNPILSRIKAFDEELGREDYAHAIGVKDELDTASIYKKHESLFSPGEIKRAKQSWNAASTTLADRCARYLHTYLVMGHIGNKLRKLSDKRSNYEAKARVRFDDKNVPYRQISALIANEPNRKRRAALFSLTKPIKKVLTKYEITGLTREKKLLKQLTGQSLIQFFQTYKQVDYAAWAKTLAGFLDRTTDAFYPLLDKELKKIKIAREDAELYDWAYYSRARPWDTHFPKAQLLNTLKVTLAGLGFDLGKLRNVELDIEERPNKVPRAFCMPLRIPEEVKLVIKPHGGQDDYQAILHESGHTMHYAHTKKTLAYELKHMGSHAVSESYAFLFEYLMTNPDWLQVYCRMNRAKAEEFANFILFQKFFFLRRYAAKVVYELKLHSNNLTRLDDHYQPIIGKKYGSMSECYSDILSKASGIHYPQENWLLDVDGGFYSLDYVRAWLTEVALRSHLSKKHGGQWFRTRAAGNTLKQYYQYGSSGITIDELNIKLTGKAPRIEPLEQELICHFRR
ncbi:hypothetical protein HY642_03995 [Candidatus Woesearchaeota archaeon]|nr:hypothetical protein [Candidatus Woesearchaeota archaeon]